MDFTRTIAVDRPFDDVLATTKEALQRQGFGTLTEIDVRRTLKEKLDADVGDQVIVGACNPRLAHRALEIDPRVAALLPCNVVVRAADGRVVVEALDPRIMAELPADPRLEPVAEEAGRLIQAALDDVAGR